MKIDLNLYAVNLPVIKRFAESNPDISTKDLVQRATTMTSVPIIVAAYFVAEVRGYNDDIQSIISNVMSFYNYESVIPLKSIDVSN